MDADGAKLLTHTKMLWGYWVKCSSLPLKTTRNTDSDECKVTIKEKQPYTLSFRGTPDVLNLLIERDEPVVVNHNYRQIVSQGNHFLTDIDQY